MKYRFLAPAAREIKDAAHYYENNVPGLGFDFIADVRSTVLRILANP